MSDISKNIKLVRKNIELAAKRSNRDLNKIKLIAISKTISTDKMKEALAEDIKYLGENKIQEAREKIKIIKDDVTWHFIGHLQSNKVKYIFDLFTLIHSIDSVTLAKEIDRRAKLKNKFMDILIQVNISGEESKFGIEKDKLIQLIKEISEFKNVNIKGLMTITPYSKDKENSRPIYRELSTIKEKINSMNIKDLNLTELSMGMSNDYEIAVEEGATLVRVGTGIFGERNYA